MTNQELVRMQAVIAVDDLQGSVAEHVCIIVCTVCTFIFWDFRSFLDLGYDNVSPPNAWKLILLCLTQILLGAFADIACKYAYFIQGIPAMGVWEEKHNKTQLLRVPK